LEPKKFIVQDVNFQEYASATIEMGEQIPTKKTKDSRTSTRLD
jgi:hypothetical protein